MANKSLYCTRAGCGKTLRSNNTRGYCGNGCLSLDAPPSIRALHLHKLSRDDKPDTGVKLKPDTGVKLAKKRKSAKRPMKTIENVIVEDVLKPASRQIQTEAEKTLAEFRAVVSALGRDPDAMLAESARSWLDAVHIAVKRIDDGVFDQDVRAEIASVAPRTLVDHYNEADDVDEVKVASTP